MKQFSTYHKILRVSALVSAFVLLFVSGVISETTSTLSLNTKDYLANAIGMSASVQPTELNMYTAQLTQKERELAEREAALREREISVNLSTGGRGADTATYILASVLFILLVLILLNYILDYLRIKETEKALTV